MAMTLRVVKSVVPPLSSLNLPEAVSPLVGLPPPDWFWSPGTRDRASRPRWRP